jgi:hypothetical protein
VIEASRSHPTSARHEQQANRPGHCAADSTQGRSKVTNQRLITRPAINKQLPDKATKQGSAGAPRSAMLSQSRKVARRRTPRPLPQRDARSATAPRDRSTRQKLADV